MKFLDKIPVVGLAVPAVLLAMAPFNAQPHLWQKLNMLVNGSLSRPLDIFDLVWHSIFIVLLVMKLIRLAQQKQAAAR